MTFQLSDELIGQIAKSLQIAILTGTDIVDHLRQFYVTPDENGKIVLTEEYREMFEEQLNNMLDQAEQWIEQGESEEALPEWNTDETLEN